MCVFLWEYEIRNSYTGQDIWSRQEVVALNEEEAKKEIKRRFGNLEYRNLRKIVGSNSGGNEERVERVS